MPQWSKKYKQCKRCNTTEFPHYQHGYCKKCWGYVRYWKHRNYFKKQLLKSYYRHHEERKRKMREYWHRKKNDEANK